MDFSFPTYPTNWDEIRAEVLERDLQRCTSCGDEEMLHIHHITPLSSGGTNDIENLITLCGNCHQLEHPHIIPVDFKQETCLYCTQCRTKYRQDNGLYHCPDCGIFLKTMKITHPETDRYDYKRYALNFEGPKFRRKRIDEHPEHNV